MLFVAERDNGARALLGYTPGVFLLLSDREDGGGLRAHVGELPGWWIHGGAPRGVGSHRVCTNPGSWRSQHRRRCFPCRGRQSGGIVSLPLHSVGGCLRAGVPAFPRETARVTRPGPRAQSEWRNQGPLTSSPIFLVVNSPCQLVAMSWLGCW